MKKKIVSTMLIIAMSLTTISSVPVFASSNPNSWAVEEVNDEERLLNAFIQQVGNNSDYLYFLPDDYDNDGNLEAFGITGWGLGEEIHSNVNIWFIDSDLNCIEVISGLYGFLKDTVDTGNEKFIVWEKSAGGSGSASYIYGYSNKKIYEPKISGYYEWFRCDNGKYYAEKGDFDKGYHDWTTYEFIYDIESKEFVNKSNYTEGKILNSDFSEFAGTYKYNSGNSFELLANGLSNTDVSSEEMKFRVEDITKETDGTYTWSVNCYYNGECMDGVICIIYPKGVEVVSYDGRILPTDNSKVRFWSGNAEVSDVQYIAYKQDETLDEIKVVLNGEEIEFDQPPIMISDRVMVPIRAIFEEMGYAVNWDSTIKTAISTKCNNKITVQLNNNVIKYTLNGNAGEYVCDVAPQIVSERTLVPVRAIAECAGCDVDWDGNNQTVIITYDEIESLFNNIYATVNSTSMDNEGKFTMTIDFFNYTNADLENVVVKFKGDSCIGTVFDYNTGFEYSSISQGSYSEDIVKVGNLKQEFNSIAFEMSCSEKQEHRFCERSHIVNIEIIGDNFNTIENKIQIQDKPNNALLVVGYASEEENISRDDVETCFLNSTQYIDNALKELGFSTEIYNMNDYNRFMEYSELSEKLDQIFKYNTSNDLSIFYYSGHSIHDKYENRKPEIANDGKGNELKEIDMENFITFQQLYDLISEKIQGNVMLIYDGCFAGELLNVKNRNNRIKILAASDDDEKSTDAYITAIKGGVWQRMLQQIFNQKEMCSIFSYVFYNGIVNERDVMDTNNNMIISFDELYSYTYKEVLEIAERLNITQTPKAYPDNDATPLFTIE